KTAVAVTILRSLTLDETVVGLAVSLFLIIGFLIDFGYFTVLEIRWRGQTIGKRMFRIRVTSSEGLRLSGNDVLLRNLLRAIDTLPYFMTLGALVASIDPYRRRLGDLAAGTVVIRDPI